MELRPGSGLVATLRDVTGNRFHFQLTLVPEADLATALTRVDAAVIARPGAARAGLLPARDSIGLEDARSPCAAHAAREGIGRFMALFAQRRPDGTEVAQTDPGSPASLTSMHSRDRDLPLFSRGRKAAARW